MDRYLIERKTDSFETIEADTVNFASGDLVLLDEDGGLVIGYARGQWVSVCLEAE